MKFELVNTPEKLAQLRTFASSFNHPTEMIHPVVMFGDKEIIGYYSVMRQPVIFPAFHPDLTTPRSFKEAIDTVSNMNCLSSISEQYPNGVAWAAIHENSPLLPMGPKVGYQDTGYKLLRRLP